MNREFDVLGLKIRLAENSESGIPPAKVLELIEKEADKLRKLSPALESGQLAVLAALRLAEDKLILEREYCENIDKFQKQAKEALEIIEKTSTEV